MTVTSHTLATALRDLSCAMAIYDAARSDEHAVELHVASDYAEWLLSEFVRQEGDIHPHYLGSAKQFPGL